MSDQPSEPGTSGDRSAPSEKRRLDGHHETRLRPGIILPLIISVALFMENLQTSALAIALPTMALDLGQTPINMRVGLTAQLVSLAVFLPLSGWLADRIGARHVFRMAVVLFICGTVTSGLTNSLEQLVIGRIIEGAGGALMVPVGRLIILQAVERSEIVRAFALMTIPALIGPMTGPIVGGFVSTYFDWRLIFWINVPIACVTLILATLFLPASQPQPPRPFDFGGYGLLASGLACIVIGTNILGVGIIPNGWVWSMLVTGLILLFLYYPWFRRQSFPVVDLDLFLIPTFAISVIGGSVFRIANGSFPFLLPIFFQFGFGMTAFEAGSIMFVMTVGALTMKFVAPGILRKFGFRGIILSTLVGTALLLSSPATFTPSMPVYSIIATLGILGFVRSLFYTSANTLAYADIPAEKMSRATTIASFSQQLSMGFGITFGAFVLFLVAGDEPIVSAGQLTPAFVAVGLVAALPLIPFFRLQRDAGVELSGHKRRSV